MHPDRSGPPVPRAFCAPDPLHQREGSERASRLEPPCGARVVGLGAPLSVRIRLAGCEIPLLRAQVQSALEQSRSPLPALGGEHSSGASEVHAWEEMLDQLPSQPIADVCVEVLWPTAYAFPVLRAAVDDALNAVAAAPRGSRDLDSMAAVLLTAQRVLDTLRAFMAVDGGGLQEVAL